MTYSTIFLKFIQRWFLMPKYIFTGVSRSFFLGTLKGYFFKLLHLKSLFSFSLTEKYFTTHKPMYSLFVLKQILIYLFRYVLYCVVGVCMNVSAWSTFIEVCVLRTHSACEPSLVRYSMIDAQTFWPCLILLNNPWILPHSMLLSDPIWTL